MMSINLIIDIDDVRLERSLLTPNWFCIKDIPVIPVDGSIFECDWLHYCPGHIGDAMQRLYEDCAASWRIYITGYKFLQNRLIIDADLRPAY